MCSVDVEACRRWVASWKRANICGRRPDFPMLSNVVIIWAGAVVPDLRDGTRVVDMDLIPLVGRGGEGCAHVDQVGDCGHMRRD